MRQWTVPSDTTGGGLIRWPGPPGFNATYSQRLEWSGIIAMREECIKHGTEKVLATYALACEEYCKRWRCTEDEINGR